MCYMFYGCESLTSMPNISRWNTDNVNNMSHMFYGCKLLIPISDIFSWTIKTERDILFLYKLPTLKNIYFP